VRPLLADDCWVDILIEGLVARLRADPFFLPPLTPLHNDVHHGLLVYEDDKVQISLGVSGAHQLAAKKSGPRGATSVGFTGQVAMLKFVRSGGALLSFWEAPRIEPGFTAAAAGQCVRTGEHRPADGDILVIDGRYQTYVIEAARSNLFILQATVAVDQAPLTVEYDSATHDFVGCAAKDDSASRIQMMTTLLRKLDCQEAFAAIAQFIDHRDFFVRWHVMKELLGIDAAAAMPHLRRMAEGDPHPDARRAARRVLDTIASSSPRKAA
jgi:HEAT repeat protein